MKLNTKHNLKTRVALEFNSSENLNLKWVCIQYEDFRLIAACYFTLIPFIVIDLFEKKNSLRKVVKWLWKYWKTYNQTKIMWTKHLFEFSTSVHWNFDQKIHFRILLTTPVEDGTMCNTIAIPKWTVLYTAIRFIFVYQFSCE